jgi:hypothetical protein
LANQKCEKDDAGNLLRCTGARPLNYVVEWAKRAETGPMKGRATRVSIQVPDRKVELKFYIKKTEPIAQPESLSQITVPSDFKTRPVPTK